jgi:DNA invertase Pin-like site-specific DNA recombinase
MNDETTTKIEPVICGGCKKEKSKCDCGRETKMTQVTIALLEEAFSNGGTDKEACFIAGISTTTLYNYCKENPEFLERKEALKEMIKYHAKANIANAIVKDKSVSLSSWYLEKKLRKEFGQNVDVTSDGEKITGIQVEIVPSKKEPAKAPEDLPTGEGIVIEVKK